jgi:acetoacetyl-CoA synthetase
VNLLLEQVPETVISEEIASIWRQVFAKPSIHDNDNFFALSGNAAQANEIFRQLSIHFERELHPTLLFQASTPAELALLLRGSRKPTIPVVITLKSGTGANPVFLLHGIAGSVLEFLELVKHMDTPLPIYGLQAQGTDGVSEPLSSIEAMANSFLSEVQKKQPSGPYLLIGHSFGGLVALEMSRQLSERGEKMGLLSMIDAYPDRSQLTPYQRVRLAIRLMRKHAANSSVHQAIHNALRTSKNPDDEKTSSAAQRVLDASLQALQSYRPHSYNGHVRFVSASIPTDFPDNPQAVWKNVLQGLQVEKVSGDHHGMLSLHARELGAVQSRYLKEALENYRA